MFDKREHGPDRDDWLTQWSGVVIEKIDWNVK